MLTSLNVQNFALIDQLHLDFDKGFTVFTGETGSGKSILLGALNLLLGERADYSVIRNTEKKTIVEGEFAIENYHLVDFFKGNDIDYSDQTVIRREIHSQGKSRAFVNDTPVQLSVLKELSERLIHIHSQHHTLSLKEVSFQYDFIDFLSGAIVYREQFSKKYSEFLKIKRELKKIKTNFQNY
jgi:DNA repair protein RecN (Recombination protein N)